jgi:AcrR family transcriptional regulator
MYHAVHSMQRKRKAEQDELLERSLAAFVKAGTIDLSLDRLAKSAGTSKRMLVHYFGGRENIEEQAMALLEESLRRQFAPESFPANIPPETVVAALWQQTTAPKNKGVLLLVMDISRRAWNGSARAKAFYAEQQRLWVELLMRYLPDQAKVEAVLQLFQGSVLAYLITGDPGPGGRALAALVSSRSATDRNPTARERTRTRKRK